MATFNLKKGYDLNLSGKPKKEIINISASDIVKISPQTFKYIKPGLCSVPKAPEMYFFMCFLQNVQVGVKRVRQIN